MMREKKLIHIHNASELDELIILGKTTENINLDFKKELDLTNRDVQSEETANDICQFINTDGGCLVIGVEEKLTLAGIKVAECYQHVDNYEDVCQFINDTVIELIFPKRNLFELKPINYHKNQIILVINIYPTTNSLYCVQSKKKKKYLQFPYRTNYGKKFFTFDEVEYRMHSSDREIYLKVKQIWKMGKEIKLLSPLVKEELLKDKVWDHREYRITIKNIFQTEIQLLINSRELNIPYSMIQDVWNTEDDKIGLIIKAKIIDPSDRSAFFLNFIEI